MRVSRDRNWEARERFSLAPTEFQAPRYSALIVKIFRRLYSAFPDSVDLTDCQNIRLYRHEIAPIWEWLKDEGFVAGELGACCMTLIGEATFSAAMRRRETDAVVLMNNVAGLEEVNASRFFLEMLRLRISARVGDRG